MGELEDDPPAPSLELENARFATALLLCNPQSDLIPPRGREILALPGFPAPLKPAMRDIMQMANWDWPTAWQNLLDLGRKVRRRGELTTSQHRQFHRYVQFIARFREEGAEQVLETLPANYSGPQSELLDWLKPWLILLAGQMRLEPAIPHLMKWLKSSYEAAADECGTALGWIGTEAVVDAVWKAWPPRRNRNGSDSLPHCVRFVPSAALRFAKSYCVLNVPKISPEFWGIGFSTNSILVRSTSSAVW